jgi:DNA invertase Pin-like site-specific DNA recombinase
MLIGYARVSTDDQNLDLQRDALRLAGCEKIYEDRMSGAKAARPGLTMALEVARTGDVLTVWRLDRLGRSLHDLIVLGRKLDEMGIGLMSVQEKIDTSSSGGRLVFHMFGALAEFERNLVRERTQAGLNAARARAQGWASKGSGAGQAAARGQALCREEAHDRRDLPDDGDLETDALQLRRRSQRVTCGAGVPPTRRW